MDLVGESISHRLRWARAHSQKIRKFYGKEHLRLKAEDQLEDTREDGGTEFRGDK